MKKKIKNKKYMSSQKLSFVKKKQFLYLVYLLKTKNSFKSLILNYFNFLIRLYKNSAKNIYFLLYFIFMYKYKKKKIANVPLNIKSILLSNSKFSFLTYNYTIIFKNLIFFTFSLLLFSNWDFYIFFLNFPSSFIILKFIYFKLKFYFLTTTITKFIYFFNLLYMYIYNKLLIIKIKLNKSVFNLNNLSLCFLFNQTFIIFFSQRLLLLLSMFSLTYLIFFNNFFKYKKKIKMKKFSFLFFFKHKLKFFKFNFFSTAITLFNFKKLKNSFFFFFIKYFYPCSWLNHKIPTANLKHVKNIISNNFLTNKLHFYNFSFMILNLKIFYNFSLFYLNSFIFFISPLIFISNIYISLSNSSISFYFYQPFFWKIFGSLFNLFSFHLFSIYYIIQTIIKIKKKTVIFTITIKRNNTFLSISSYKNTLQSNSAGILNLNPGDISKKLRFFYRHFLLNIDANKPKGTYNRFNKYFFNLVKIYSKLFNEKNNRAKPSNLKKTNYFFVNKIFENILLKKTVIKYIYGRLVSKFKYWSKKYGDLINSLYLNGVAIKVTAKFYIFNINKNFSNISFKTYYHGFNNKRFYTNNIRWSKIYFYSIIRLKSTFMFVYFKLKNTRNYYRSNRIYRSIFYIMNNPRLNLLKIEDSLNYSYGGLSKLKFKIQKRKKFYNKLY